MSESEFRLGTRERWGEQTCGYGVDIPACHAPATKHLMFLEPNSVVLTCDEHLGFIEERSHMDFEMHTVGPDCSMPGAFWHHPYEDEDEGWCMFDGPDDASAMIEEPEPLSVTSAAVNVANRTPDLPASAEEAGA